MGIGHMGNMLNPSLRRFRIRGPHIPVKLQRSAVVKGRFDIIKKDRLSIYIYIYI